MSHLFKSFALSALFALAMSPAFANTNTIQEDDKQEVDITPQTQVTREEIATIQVLSEICPQIIGKNKNFDAGYKHLLAENLSNFKNPELALQALNQEKDYLPILKQARNNAAKASREDNRAICLEVIDLSKKK